MSFTFLAKEPLFVKKGRYKEFLIVKTFLIVKIFNLKIVIK